MSKLTSPVWHHLSTEQALAQQHVTIEQGLDQSQAQQRLQQFGANRLAVKSSKSVWALWFSQFTEPLVYILVASGIITAFLQEWVDSSVIFAVVLLNAIIGFVQESNAIKAIESLANVLSISATVRRNSEKRTLDAAELVPGDIVFLQSGDKVPADVRLLQVRELRVDESALTGESLPVEKHSAVLPPTTLLADRLNMAYSSTLVTYGFAIGLVVATGENSEIGRIQKMIASADILETPLTRKISDFSTRLLWLIIGFAVITFAVGLLRGETLLDMFMASVALAVGAIPEGLPAALTITLAIGVSRMAKRHAIIRKLPAVETLGSTTVICSDKTGTLTQNQMTVQAIFAGGQLFAVEGSGYEPCGGFVLNQQNIDFAAFPALMECLKAGLLCNDARLIQDADGWRIEGDPTEAALVVAAQKAGLLHLDFNHSHPRLDALPFESQHQFMATLHHDHAQAVRPVYLKGSVESILSRCQDGYDAALHRVALDKAAVQRQVAQFAEQGLRVLALARVDFALDDDTVEHHEVAAGLTFIGLQAMIDPVRPEAVAAIAACHQAGIRVKMITGDHPGTALAIAVKLGLFKIPRLHRLFNISLHRHVISGAELENLDDAQYRDLVNRYDVYARISPEQKLRLVRALQSHGAIVAMTGDGVNDAPALRQADIGIAMGQCGTEVAKEAADMLLTDDNFATIAAAVEEGRGVFDNLIKFIVWTLPTNIGEGLVITVAVFAGVELPITPLQILWINMSTAVLLGLMLAFEPKEPGLMLRHPRKPDAPILSKALIRRICLVGGLLLIAAFGLFYWEIQHGEPLAVAQTVAVNVFVFGELFYLFNCRSLEHSMFRVGLFSNAWAVGGVSLMIVLQLLFTYWSPMQTAFTSAAIGLDEWVLILASSVLIYLTIELEKRLCKILIKRNGSTL